jgi:4,5-DOPA dioxygenase extradiol
MTAAPVLFVSHGAPTVALEQGAFADALARFGAAVRPRSVLIVSAHWTTPWEIGITSAARHRLIYDFSGFPEELYRIQWPAPGAPDVAARAAALLEGAGFRARLDPVRGLDHGAWVPLRLAFPGADVPVAQLALPAVAPEMLLRLGAALASLRAEGVLLVASGGLLHNLGLVRFDETAAPDAWAREFDAWAAARIAALDVEALLRWRDEAPHAKRAAPSSEHLDPLFVALGARLPADRVELLHQDIRYGNLGMRSFVLRPAGEQAGTPRKPLERSRS